MGGERSLGSLSGLLLLTLAGILAGYFVVPMNALLQHRGHLLMGAGHSIAQQNFNENISILLLTGAYALMVRADWHIHTIVLVFGLFIIWVVLGNFVGQYHELVSEVLILLRDMVGAS